MHRVGVVVAVAAEQVEREAGLAAIGDLAAPPGRPWGPRARITPAGQDQAV
jgi:hypothetical protein